MNHSAPIVGDVTTANAVCLLMTHDGTLSTDLHGTPSLLPFQGAPTYSSKHEYGRGGGESGVSEVSDLGIKRRKSWVVHELFTLP